MLALRRAATLAHNLPGVRVRLRQGKNALLDVRSEAGDTVPAVSPCAFRVAVAGPMRR